jgi:hypothetical protein
MKQGEFLGPHSFIVILILLFFSIFSHMVPFNQPEAAVVCFHSFFTLPSNLLFTSLVALSCLCLFPCPFSKSPGASFYASVLMLFLIGFNYSVDYGSPSTA